MTRMAEQSRSCRDDVSDEGIVWWDDRDVRSRRFRNAFGRLSPTEHSSGLWHGEARRLALSAQFSSAAVNRPPKAAQSKRRGAESRQRSDQFGELYLACHGLRRLLLYVTIGLLPRTKRQWRVKQSAILERAREEIHLRGEACPDEEIRYALESLLEKGLLQERGDYAQLTARGRAAYCDEITARAIVDEQAVSRDTILAAVQATQDLLATVATSSAYTHDPRLTKHGEITDTDLSTWLFHLGVPFALQARAISVLVQSGCCDVMPIGRADLGMLYSLSTSRRPNNVDVAVSRLMKKEHNDPFVLKDALLRILAQLEITWRERAGRLATMTSRHYATDELKSDEWPTRGSPLSTLEVIVRRFFPCAHNAPDYGLHESESYSELAEVFNRRDVSVVAEYFGTRARLAGDPIFGATIAALGNGTIRCVRFEPIPCGYNGPDIAHSPARTWFGPVLRVASSDRTFCADSGPQPTDDPTVRHATRPENPPMHKPEWDEDDRVLMYGGQVCKRYKHEATNQWTILRAFEEEKWCDFIDDPLPPRAETTPTKRLHDTVGTLNRKLLKVKFHVTGGGTRIRWTAS